LESGKACTVGHRKQSDKGYLRTVPVTLSFLECSRPYDKDLAKQLDQHRLSSGMDFSDQPDFRSEFLGNVEDEL
jgi:hypothetical protein